MWHKSRETEDFYNAQIVALQTRFLQFQSYFGDLFCLDEDRYAASQILKFILRGISVAEGVHQAITLSSISTIIAWM